jgi:hypothetical protein
VARAIAKIGASVDSEPSMSPVIAGCTRCRRNLADGADDGDERGDADEAALAVWHLPGASTAAL